MWIREYGRMNIPFLIIVIIYGMTWSIDLVEHGKIVERKVNAGKTLVGTICLFYLIHLAITQGY